MENVPQLLRSPEYVEFKGGRAPGSTWSRASSWPPTTASRSCDAARSRSASAATSRMAGADAFPDWELPLGTEGNQPWRTFQWR